MRHYTRSKPWPRTIRTTATYIGFRTKRKKPRKTRVRVGKAGAGVPKPSIAKRTNESSSAGMASAMRIMPIGRLAGTATRGGCSCQPEINQGTSPATTPRAMTKKTADPKTAGNFLISDQSNLCLSGTWSSCSASSPSATPERLFFICSEFRARMFQKGRRE